jgi:isoaspartyl peptidase/L-asparaginase-like protein (Ntn-hydrolase superfamily)
MKLNLVGKLFFAGAGAWLANRASKLKVRGTPEEIKKLAAALRASRRFQEELKKSGATTDSVIEKLGLKHARGKEFERITGVPWPL